MGIETRVARRFIAEILSKSWLMGVRRGWLAVLNSHPHGWDQILGSIKQLKTFTDRLTEDVLFVHRAPYASHFTMSNYETLMAAFKKLKDAIGEQLSHAEHWMNVDKDPEEYGRGTFTKDQAQQMLHLYESDFAGHMTTYVKKRINPAKGDYIDSREASITVLMDEILALLRAEAKILDDTLGDPSKPTPDVIRPAYKDFELNGVKVIIDDSHLSAVQIEEYIKFLDEAHARLRAKGFEKVWYGTIFVKCEMCGGQNPNVRRDPSDHSPSVGGNYPSNFDTVNVFSRPSPFIVELMCHELGHRYWYKILTESHRAQFTDLVRTHTKTAPPPVKLENGKAIKEKVSKVVNDIWDTLLYLPKNETLSKDQVFNNTKVDILLWNLTNNGQHGNLRKAVMEAISDDYLFTYMRLADVDPGLTALRKAVEEACYKAQLELMAARTILDMDMNTRDKWVDTAGEAVNAVEATAFVYVDAATKTYNELEKKKDDEWADDLKTAPGSVAPVSEYGASNISEAFAEAFTHYVLGRDMNRDQLDSFKAVTRKTASVPFKEEDLKDGITFVNETYDDADPQEHPVDVPPIHRQDLKYVGIKLMNPKDFIDESTLLGPDPKGWLTKFPKKEWLAELRSLASRDYTLTLKLYENGQLAPGIQINGRMADGRGRAIFYWAIGQDIPVAVFKSKKGKTASGILSLFHATKESNVESIKREGLRFAKPPFGVRAEDWYTLADTPGIALVGMGQMGAHAVLEFQIPSGEVSAYLHPGSRAADGAMYDGLYAIKQALPAEWLQAITHADGRTVYRRKKTSQQAPSPKDLAAAIKFLNWEFHRSGLEWDEDKLWFRGIKDMWPQEFASGIDRFKSLANKPFGWLKDKPLEEVETTLDANIGSVADSGTYFPRIIEMYQQGTLRPAIMIDGLPGDGMHRAHFFNAIGKRMPVAMYWSEEGVQTPKTAVTDRGWPEYFSPKGLTLQQVVDRVKGGDKPYDEQVLMDPKALWAIRDYTWSRNNLRAGAVPDGPPKADGSPAKYKQMEGPERWDALVDWMKTYGWRVDPAHVDIDKTGRVKLGEGNHRVAIALHIGLSQVPVMFHVNHEVSPTSEKALAPRHMASIYRAAIRKAAQDPEGLKQYLDLVDKMSGGKSIESFVKQHGQTFHFDADSFKGGGVPHLCYMNAAKMAQDNPSLKYAEGFLSLHGVPIQHVWCVDKEGKVVDPTLDKKAAKSVDAYHGVLFNTAHLNKTLLRTGVYGMLGGHNMTLMQGKDKGFKETKVAEDLTTRYNREAVQKVARVFGTPQALQKYLREHPMADRSKHSVSPEAAQRARDQADEEARKRAQPPPRPNEPTPEPEEAPEEEHEEDTEENLVHPHATGPADENGWAPLKVTPVAKSKDGHDHAPAGAQLPEEVRAALKKLKISKLPAAHISEIFVSPRLNNPELADTGALLRWFDDHGHEQRTYSAEFDRRNAEVKWKRVEAIRPKVKEAIEGLEAKAVNSPAHALALLISETGLRPGSDESVQKYGHFGAVTLLKRHIKFVGQDARIEFVGKEGEVNRATVSDPSLVQALKKAAEGKSSGERLFHVRKEEVARTMPKGVKLKDLRTVLATDTAESELLRITPTLTGDKKKDARMVLGIIKKVSKTVSEKLNNTEAMARRCYIHPSVFRAWGQRNNLPSTWLE
jgi:DNA topoisomerase IB